MTHYSSLSPTSHLYHNSTTGIATYKSYSLYDNNINSYNNNSNDNNRNANNSNKSTATQQPQQQPQHRQRPQQHKLQSYSLKPVVKAFFSFCSNK